MKNKTKTNHDIFRRIGFLKKKIVKTFSAD